MFFFSSECSSAMSGKEEGTRECCGPNANCCCCRVEWAMWGNMNALYAAASEYGSMSVFEICRPPVQRHKHQTKI